MTVDSEQSSVEYTGDGSTTVFSVPFYFQDEDHLVVTYEDALGVAVELELDTDYTVTGEGVPGGGSVTFITAPIAAREVVIYRDPPVTQPTNLAEAGSFSPRTHMTALDRLTMICQRLASRMDELEASPDFLALVESIGTYEDLLTILEDVQALLSSENTWTQVNHFSDLDVQDAEIDTIVAQYVDFDPQSKFDAMFFSSTRPAGALDRQLVAEFFVHSTLAQKVRIYIAEAGWGGRIEITLNAQWNGTGWVPDATFNAALYGFDGRDFTTLRKAGATEAVQFTTWDVYVQNARTTLTAAAGFTAGSTNNAPRYWLGSTGMVGLMGNITRSGGNTTTFPTLVAAGGLAAGCRPLAARRIPCVISRAGVADPCTLVIGTDGSILVETYNAGTIFTNDVIYLDGVTFPAEQ